jgi:hypothetical protein
MQPGAASSRTTQVTLDTIDAEYDYMRRIVKNGFGTQEYLCGGLTLSSTQQWHPKDNPYWVVQTSDSVIRDHNDVFNPHFITFIRQLYLALIFARENVSGNGDEKNPCERSK